MPERQAISFDLFLGDANPAEARLYLRAAVDAAEGKFADSADSSDSAAAPGWQLSGEVEGPYCRLAATLSAVVRLVDRSDASGPLAQALLPDPCFWSSELPYLYQVRAELRRGGQVVARCQRSVGLRPWGVRGTRFVFEGKQWVLRAAWQDRFPDAPLDQWHSTGTALWIRQPDDALCEAASRHGVLVCAVVSGNAAEIVCHLRRLARHAAVGLALIEPTVPEQSTLTRSVLRRAAPNLLLASALEAASCDPADAGKPCWPDWAQVAVVSDFDPARLARVAARCKVPVIAAACPAPVSELPAPNSAESRPADVVEARAACDLLQRRLAGSGDYAGYLV